MSTFTKPKSKDYAKKQNMMQNNWKAEDRAKRTRLNEGDGIIPKSVKYLSWSCKGEGECKKKHEHKLKGVVHGSLVTA